MTDFYAEKKVIVTGGAGMLGSALVSELVNARADVTVLDDFSRGSTCVPGVTYVVGDAGHRSQCERLFLDAFAVFNLAAYVAGVLYNQYHHGQMFQRNVRLQTVPVLAASECQVPHFLQVSSVCVYAEEYQNPCLEENGWLGEPNLCNAGYAWAKRMGERTVVWSHLPHSVVVRPANMYGLHDYYDDRAHVIPALIRKAARDDVIHLHGTGREVREFLYADDCARACLVALEHGEGVYNVGSNGANACSMLNLAEMVRENLKVDKDIVCDGGDGGDLQRTVNADRLMALGWEPRVSLCDGLARVCEGYRRQ